MKTVISVFAFMITVLITEAISQRHYTITLQDDQTVTADSISINDTVIVLHFDDGTVILTDRLIQSIDSFETSSHQTRFFYRDPNRTRYLYSPTAFMLIPGEIALSQKELFFTTVGIGIHKNITLQAGSAIPLLFSPEGTNGIIAIKTGARITPYINLAGGLQLFALPESMLILLPFITITLGDEDFHGTLNVTFPGNLNSNSETDIGLLSLFDTDNSLLSLSGLYRIHNRFAFVTENLYFPFSGNDGRDIKNMISIAGRIMGRQLSVDAGLIFIPNSDIPLPWLDFTYHFDP